MSEPVNPGALKVRLEVRRCAFGESFILRTLGDHYGGLFVHVIKKRGYYCPHPAAPCKDHKEPLQWKGYAAVQVWDKERQLWLPATFELTESFELDVRHKWERGQIWEVSRGPREIDHATPVVGRLIDQVDPLRIPEEFDYTPPVHAIYHAFTINFDRPNPMPDRVTLEASAGEPPPGGNSLSESLDGFEQARKRQLEINRRYLDNKQRRNGKK